MTREEKAIEIMKQGGYFTQEFTHKARLYLNGRIVRGYSTTTLYRMIGKGLVKRDFNRLLNGFITYYVLSDS